MIHQRHVIREALVALLAAGGTAAAGRVFDHPYDPRSTFPALVVEDDSEAQRAMTIHGATAPMERSYRFVVTAEASTPQERDQLLADVEALVVTSAITGVKSVTQLSYQPQPIRQTAERQLCVGHQLFELVYLTPQGDPSTVL